jgi:hypothetical protein
MEGRLYEPAGAESLAVWSIAPAVWLTGVEPETTILPAPFSRNPDYMRRHSASDDATAADYGDDRMLERVRYVMPSDTAVDRAEIEAHRGEYTRCWPHRYKTYSLGFTPTFEALYEQVGNLSLPCSSPEARPWPTATRSLPP